MKIGIYSHAWPGLATPNGITTANVQLTAGLEARGHEISVITPTVEEPAENVFALASARRPSLIDRFRFRLGHDHVHVGYYADQIIDTVRIAMAARGIEVLLIEETQGLAAMIQAALPIPVVMVLHGPWFLLEPLSGPEQTAMLINRGRIGREAAAFHACAGLSAPSQVVLDSMVAAYGAPAVPMEAIPNPIALKDPLDPGVLDDQARRSFLFVGRFDKLKGGDVLLQGFARLIAGGADARLTIVGSDHGVPLAEDPDKPVPLEAWLARLTPEVQGRITWLGKRSKAEIDQLRRRHLAALVTSRYETFGYTVLESMAAGAATIAPRTGGIPEIIDDGSTGLLMPPEDPDALAAACLHLLMDPDTAAAIGARARSVVAERFQPATVACRWERFLADVIRTRGGA